MEILGLLLVIGLVLATVYFAFFAIGVCALLVWTGLPLIAGIAGGAVLWGLGHDNIGVLAAAAGIALQLTMWNDWSDKHNPVFWVENRFDDLLKSIGLKKRDPFKECPTCGSQTFRVIKGATKTIPDTETRRRRVTHYSTQGEERGYSEAEYEVPSTTTLTGERRRCATCSHEWAVGWSDGVPVRLDDQ